MYSRIDPLIEFIFKVDLIKLLVLRIDQLFDEI